MSQVIKYETESCYQATVNDTVLVSTSHQQSMHQEWVQTVMKGLLAAAVFHTSMNKFMKHKLSNDVTVYEASDAITQIEIVVYDHLFLFKDCNNIVNISEKKWMNISLLNDCHNKYRPSQVRICSLDVNDWGVVNKVFDKLHDQNCIKWINTLTSFSLSCFVVWCTLSDNTHKDCIIVDIQTLNKISMSDAYSVSSQINILAAVQEVKYIFIINYSVYCYQ